MPCWGRWRTLRSSTTISEPILQKLFEQSQRKVDLTYVRIRPSVFKKIGIEADRVNSIATYDDMIRIAPELKRKCNAAYVSFDELLTQSDFVVLQMPYNPQTHHLIGAAQLEKMKRSAILINSTRGGVVDDAALVRALQDGTIRGAGLDVFENEPKLNPGFLKLDNVVLAPHIGSSTEATRKAMAMLAARNLVAALTGAAPPNLLNPGAAPQGKK